MRHAGWGILAGMVLATGLLAMMEHVLLAHTRTATAMRPLTQATVQTGRICPSALGLPAWTAGSNVVTLALTDPGSPYSGVEYVGPDLRVEYTWTERGWSFLVGGPMGGAPTYVEDAFAKGPLPPRGTLDWQYRRGAWTGMAAWTEGRRCYDMRLAAAPQAAAVVAAVLRAWMARPAQHYHCTTHAGRPVCAPG